MSQTFADQHAQLIELSRAILSVARRYTPALQGELARLRLAFSRAITDHVDSEGHIVTSNRTNGDDTTRSPLIVRYHDELLAWRRALVDCNASWPLKRVAEEPAQFAAAYLPIHMALEQRIAWEERVFYPQILSSAQLRKAA